jgi:pimeloyl-ACP methyl ester carboxylesterase
VRLRLGSARAGLSVFARVEGSGPWLTLLHGFPASSWDYSRVVPLLASRFRVLTFDFLGYGESDKGKGIVHSTALNADTVEALWAHFGVRETILVGHDIGTAVTQELLARDRERTSETKLRGAVLLNGVVFNDRYRPTTLQRLLLNPFCGPLMARVMSERAYRAGLEKAWGPTTRPSDAECRTMWSAFRRRSGQLHTHRLLHHIPERHRFKTRWEGALVHTAVPLRFVWGMRDPFTAFVVEDIRRNLPHADIVELPEVGHFPPLEAPNAVADAIDAFVR